MTFESNFSTTVGVPELPPICKREHVHTRCVPYKGTMTSTNDPAPTSVLLSTRS